MLEEVLITVLLLLIVVGIPGFVIMKVKNPCIAVLTLILTLVLFISSVVTVVDYKAKTIAEHNTTRKN